MALRPPSGWEPVERDADKEICPLSELFLVASRHSQSVYAEPSGQLVPLTFHSTRLIF